MTENQPEVGEVWIDQDPRVMAKRAEVTKVEGDRVYYTRGARKCNSAVRRFIKAFKLERA